LAGGAMNLYSEGVFLGVVARASYGHSPKSIVKLSGHFMLKSFIQSNRIRAEMSKKENCWEFMHCGREPGGKKADEIGICPVSTNPKYNGVNGGKNSGRYCWAMSRTFCKGKILGTFAKAYYNCLLCPFLLATSDEEGFFFVLQEEDLHKFPHLR